MNKTKIDPFELAKWGIVIAGGFFAYKLMRGIGLIKTADEQKQAEKEKKDEQAAQDIISSNYKPLNPLFYQDLLKQNPGKEVVIITENNVKAYIQNLKAAKGIFNDDEALLFRQFSNLSTQSQVSYLAFKFALSTNRDLSTYLSDMLSESELIKLNNIIQSKPIGLRDPKTKKIIK